MWSKSSNFSVATRSPLILSKPGMKSKHRKTRALVESVDIFPTPTELCGLPQPLITEGCSFAQLLDDPDRPWKKAAFSMYFRGKEPNRTIGFSMLTERYRYTEWVTGWTEYHSTTPGEYKMVARELYDHGTDREENVNIAGDPANEELIRELSDQLYSGWKEAGPEGWSPKPFPVDWESNDWMPGWINTGFESGGMMGWEAMGEDLNVSVSFVDYHNGGHSLLIADRKEKGHTVRQNIQLKPGKGHKVIIWVKCLKGKSSATLQISYGSNDKQETKVIDQKDVDDQQWTKLEGWFRDGSLLPDSEQHVSVVLDELVDFYLDDFSIE